MTMWPPFLLRCSPSVSSCVMLQTLHHHPGLKKCTTTSLNDHGPLNLISVVMKSFERLVLKHLKGIKGRCWIPAFCFLFKQDDTATFGRHYIFHHFNHEGMNILFEDLAIQHHDQRHSPPQAHSAYRYSTC